MVESDIDRDGRWAIALSEKKQLRYTQNIMKLL